VQIAVLVLSILTLLTKVSECLARFLRYTSIYQEDNLLMRALMQKIGIGAALCVSVLIESAFIAYAYFAMIEPDTDMMDYILFFTLGIVVMYIQISEARYYYTGKANWIIRKMRMRP